MTVPKPPEPGPNDPDPEEGDPVEGEVEPEAEPEAEGEEIDLGDEIKRSVREALTESFKPKPKSTADPPTSPGAAQPPAPSGPAVDIKAEIRAALAEAKRDEAIDGLKTQVADLAKPVIAPPTPPRRGLGSIFWGAKR